MTVVGGRICWMFGAKKKATRYKNTLKVRELGCNRCVLLPSCLANNETDNQVGIKY